MNRLFIHAFLYQTLTILSRIGITYLAVDIGLDATHVGLISGAFGLPALFGLNFGRYIDRAGERAALVWGSLFMVGTSACLALTPPSFIVLVVLSFLLGIGQFLGVAAQQSAVGRSLTHNGVNYYGRLTLVVSLAQTAGPLFLVFFTSDQLVPDTRTLFALASIMGIVTLLLALGSNGFPPQAGASPMRLMRMANVLLTTRGYLLATTASLVVVGATDLIVVFLPLLGAEHSIAAGTIGMLLSMRACASMISRIFFNWLLDRLGMSRLLTASLLLASFGIGALTLSTNAFVMGAMLFIAGIGLGIGAPLTLTWLVRIVPADIQGSAISGRLALNALALVAAPVFAGSAILTIGIGGVFLAISACLVADAAVIALRRNNPERV